MEINGKPRIIFWIISDDGRYIGNAINILERQHNGVEIVGITATQKISVNNLPFIPLNEISMNGGGYDIILVAGAKKIGMAEVVKFARTINLDVDKLLGDWIVCIPGFTLQKYRQLQRSKLSMFTVNCFGGLISNTFGLPFYSPFINMFMEHKEFNLFLRNPRTYMKKDVIYKGQALEPNAKIYYPVGLMGDVSLHFNHSKTFDEAAVKWNERKQRINWYNLFVMTYTESQEIAENFDELPHGKKVCFVSFKSNLDSAFYINKDFASAFFKKDLAFWDVVNRYSRGEIFYYDPFDMLLYGKKTPLIEM